MPTTERDPERRPEPPDPEARTVLSPAVGVTVRCPDCGQADLELAFDEREGGSVVRPLHCWACDAWWRVSVAIELERVPPPPAPGEAPRWRRNGPYREYVPGPPRRQARYVRNRDNPVLFDVYSTDSRHQQHRLVDNEEEARRLVDEWNGEEEG